MLAPPAPPAPVASSRPPSPLGPAQHAHVANKPACTALQVDIMSSRSQSQLDCVTETHKNGINNTSDNDYKADILIKMHASQG